MPFIMRQVTDIRKDCTDHSVQSGFSGELIMHRVPEVTDQEFHFFMYPP